MGARVGVFEKIFIYVLREGCQIWIGVGDDLGEMNDVVVNENFFY